MSLTTTRQTFEQTYAEVLQFYAGHIQAMDEGRVDEVVSTFTDDASLVSPPKIAEPVRGRENLRAGLRRAAAAQAAEGVRYRRCHTMMSVRPGPDGELFVRAYVQVVRTGPEGGSHLHAMCVCADVLVRRNDTWQIRERVVVRDDHDPATRAGNGRDAGPGSGRDAGAGHGRVDSGSSGHE
ncbi:nuclear transport factor 2 family protein [Micromonospora sp. WMMD987]|uniref:nuclear transport factor 2 family protein n=1 Tax=Micromonospora sp. WMMD987 TaxID=3016089 RepID=UPI00249B21ED|nr:nuclear transport factor 2 family protein [Micromonospora sp. WMMD987]WFE95402.1 nuclear transport factor 2 family protein [Micromonospora sp. WMMD987]